MNTEAVVLSESTANTDQEVCHEQQELLSYYVRVSDLCRLIQDTPRVKEETKRQLIAAFRRHAGDSPGLPYYTFPLIIGEVEKRMEAPGAHAPRKGKEEEFCDFQRVIMMLRRAGPERIPVLEESELVIH